MDIKLMIKNVRNNTWPLVDLISFTGGTGTIRAEHNPAAPHLEPNPRYYINVVETEDSPGASVQLWEQDLRNLRDFAVAALVVIKSG